MLGEPGSCPILPLTIFVAMGKALRISAKSGSSFAKGVLNGCLAQLPECHVCGEGQAGQSWSPHSAWPSTAGLAGAGSGARIRLPSLQAHGCARRESPDGVPGRSLQVPTLPRLVVQRGDSGSDACASPAPIVRIRSFPESPAARLPRGACREAPTRAWDSVGLTPTSSLPSFLTFLSFLS